MELSPVELARLVEFGEAEAYANMYADAPPELGCRVDHIGSAIMLTLPALPIVLFNRVVGLGLDEPATPAIVDTIVQNYRNVGVSNYAVQLSTHFQPPELPAWLLTGRLTKRGNWAKVYRIPDGGVSIDTNLRVERIDRQQAGVFAQVAAASFGMPPFVTPWLEGMVGRAGWSHYLAYEGDMPMACGALFIRNKVGWLGIGGTLPAYRQRGAQGALMAQRIRDAAALGCNWVIRETGEDTAEYPNPSYHNMYGQALSWRTYVPVM